MASKSSSKKKKTVSWLFCELCSIYITSNDFEKHEKCCPNKNDTMEYIHKNVLYTTSLEKRPFSVGELADTSNKFLNNLIFLSEGVMKLCKLHIGQNVAIHVVDENLLPPLIRSVWPIPEKFLTTVFVSPEDYTLNWERYKKYSFRIQNISNGSIHPAENVKFLLVGKYNFHQKQLENIETILKIRSKNLVYTRNSIIRLNFYNRPLELKVLEWNSLLPLDSDSELLATRIENLSLAEHGEFFQVLHSTRVNITQEDIHPKKDQEKSNAFVFTKRDIGGLGEKIDMIEESISIAFGIKYVQAGVNYPRCCLLYGPSGCGKTMICEAMASSANINLIRINSCELFSKFLGETEKNLKEHFDCAFSNYPKPTLMIIEDIHTLCPKTETSEISKRISMAFITMLDNLHSRTEGSKVFLLATTNNINNVNPAIRRCRRFETEIEIAVPTPKGRQEIIKCLLNHVSHNLNDNNILEISCITHGFVGSDLANLIHRSIIASKKNNNENLNLSDIYETLHFVKPSAMREVLIECPNVKWTDIGGQHDLKLKLKQAIEWPLLYPEKFERLGIKPPRGILMFGPPGCSKTMIAKALATESQVNFLSIKGPELFSMWVGESERAVREVFQKARQVSPAIIFFDEIDAIGGERTSDTGSSVKERVLTQLLTELDGVNTLKNVTIVAATNRPDMIDKALLRPGRIDRLIYVGLPNKETRKEIFSIKLKRMSLDENIEINKLVTLTDGYSGAEIQALCDEAALKALEIDLNAEKVQWAEFEHALKIVKPRTSMDLLKLYDEYIKKI